MQQASRKKVLAPEDAGRRVGESGRPRKVMDGGKVITELVGPESDSPRRIKSEFDGSAGIAIKSVGGASCPGKVSRQRVVAKLFVDLRSRDGDGEQLLNFRDEAGAIEAHGEVSTMAAARLVKQVFTGWGWGGEVGAAKYAERVRTTGAPGGEAAKAARGPGRRRPKEAGGKQEDGGD